MRVIEYTLPRVPNAEPSHRRVTTLLDPEKAPVAEWAALYHDRWESETAFGELKRRVCGVPGWSCGTRRRTWTAKRRTACRRTLPGVAAFRP